MTDAAGAVGRRVSPDPMFMLWVGWMLEVIFDSNGSTPRIEFLLLETRTVEAVNGYLGGDLTHKDHQITDQNTILTV